MSKKIFIVIFTLLLVATTPFSKEVGTLLEKGDIIENFESGDLANWEIVSGSLKKQPASTWREGIRFNQEGKYFIGTTETGGTSRGDFDDKLTGELCSKPFPIKRNFITLLVGGGNDPENLFISLVREEDGYVIQKATGNDSEEMKQIYWDVSDHIGKLCHFRIVDNSKGDWGHINVDDIRTCDTRDEVTFSPLVIAGAFNRIYNPSIGENEKWYINDHCFIRGKDGTWHLFGITRQEPARPLEEDNLAHATSPKLTQFPWKKQAFALSVMSDPWKEEHLWAPYVVYHDKKYYMYYCAGDKDGSKYKIHLATSKDLWKWERHPANPMVVDGFDARDPFVTRIGKKWVMYYTANSKPEGGNHVVAYRTSDDLVKWGERNIAFTDPSVGRGGGPTESPFVVKRGEYYYLFIGPRGGYVGTDVFQSKDPFHFPIENLVGHIESHAAEVIRDVDGKWYVSHCGWGRGGVYLAPLYWNDGMDNVETSPPIPGK
jgi:arabinan endo-1,5-alpha-L-arabinosidase